MMAKIMKWGRAAGAINIKYGRHFLNGKRGAAPQRALGYVPGRRLR
jgi:hypothetical protein